MKLSQAVALIQGKVICGQVLLDDQVPSAFASDLMSDVLTVKASNFMLITGLANVQAIRTAEMSDLRCVVLVRGKKATDDMIRLAVENDMILIETPFSMFRTAGVLFAAGVKPIY